MLKKVDRLVCAWISLMLEKHTDRTGFELKDVLFTREELANRASCFRIAAHKSFGKKLSSACNCYPAGWG